ncbi:opsin: ultraviolet-sensitive-like protein [Dinothrombium tinctorium]|nr:opsin: ultraviolet-sensitive-like protein [Dinothrombium tinctorium]
MASVANEVESSSFSSDDIRLGQLSGHCRPLLMRDVVPESALYYINDYWLQFEKPTQCALYLIGVLFLILFVLGFLGNFTVLWLYFRNEVLRTPSNLLVVNLCLADLGMQGKNFYIFKLAFSENFVISQKMCQAYGISGGITGAGAILTVTAMAVDRYNVITRPLHPRRLTKTTSVLLVLAIWLYSGLLTGVQFLFTDTVFKPEGYFLSCAVDYFSTDNFVRYYIVAYFVLGYCIPLSTIIFCYYGIIKAVRHSEKGLRAFAEKSQSTTSLSSNDSKKAKEDKAKRREDVQITKTAAGLISVWLMAWTPHAVIALMGISGHREYISITAVVVETVFCKIASCFDPFIYGLSHPRFRECLLEALGMNKAKKQASDEDTYTVQTVDSSNTQNNQN